MALIECSECAAHISDKAKVCIKCGAPVELPTESDDIDAKPSTRVVTTQQTGKPYKAAQAVGVVLILIGVVSCTASEFKTSVALNAVGLLLYIGGRMGAWWDHG